MTIHVAEPVVTFKERHVTPTGREGFTTHTHYWCVCDVCGEGSWFAAIPAAKCRCGHAEKSHDFGYECKTCTKNGKLCEAFTGDDMPGKACRMTPRCPGKHRKPEEK